MLSIKGISKREFNNVGFSSNLVKKRYAIFFIQIASNVRINPVYLKGNLSKLLTI